MSTISTVAAAVGSAISAAMPTDEDTRIVVTPRGAAVVAIYRFERILTEIPSDERACALASLREHHLDLLDLDDEDREYLAPYLEDLAAAVGYRSTLRGGQEALILADNDDLAMERWGAEGKTDGNQG